MRGRVHSALNAGHWGRLGLSKYIFWGSSPRLAPRDAIGCNSASGKRGIHGKPHLRWSSPICSCVMNVTSAPGRKEQLAAGRPSNRAMTLLLIGSGYPLTGTKAYRHWYRYNNPLARCMSFRTNPLQLIVSQSSLFSQSAHAYGDRYTYHRPRADP